MTYTLSVQTGDVMGFRAFAYQHHGPTVHCGYLFAARHELHVFIEDGDFQSLAGAGNSATLLRVSLDRRAARLTLSAPDFGDGTLFPFERPAKQRAVDVTVSGDAVLRRTRTNPVRYQLVVGMLRCAFGPMFELLREGAGRPSALASFWPSLPNAAADLDYVFTPYGLALEGALDLRIPARRDVLLLPRYRPGAADGDAAWVAVPDSEKNGTHTWERLDTPAPAPLKPNLAALVERLRADAPDAGAWPAAQPRWAMLRWRLMTPERQPFLDHCFADTASGVRLERPALDPAATQSVFAELVCQLWVQVDGKTSWLEHGGMVCSLAGTAMLAHFTWDARERNSVLTAPVARAALWLAGAGVAPPGALFNVVRQTLRTADAMGGPAPNLVLAWARGQAPSTARLTLAATGMLCAGAVAGGAGIDPPPAPPGWLMLEEGCLQLSPAALPLDTEDRRPAAALLAAAADSGQVFRGGLPLAALGGPPGLTAWLSRSATGAEPQAVLRIDRFTVELDLYDAILVWRTPGWWACAEAVPEDAQQDALRVPPLGAAFVEALAAAPANAGDTNARLGQALASILFPALWVGRAGVVAASGWPLDVHADGQASFTVPAAAVRATVLWSAFRDAYLVQTLPAGGQALGGPLLDPTRALVPLTHVEGESLRLVPGASGLLQLVAPRYPSPSQLAGGWTPRGGELFHPNIAGLTLEPSATHYVLRHGPPILTDGYLRTRPDGSGGKLASIALDAVRPADDIAIDAIALVPQPTTAYRVRGWLAAPQTVAATRLALELGGAEPQLAMVAAGGADDGEALVLRIGSRHDGFVDPVAVLPDARDDTSYLSARAGRGKLLRNFGQPLMVDDVRRQFRDGAGRVWTPFAGGVRAIAGQGIDGTRRLLTQQRRGVLGGGALGPVELGLCLADFDPAPTGSGSWDLSGPLHREAGSPPMFGPFLLQADTLRAVGLELAEVTARLGLPHDAPGLPAVAAAGELLLRWQAAGQGWNLALADGASFEWRIDPMPGTDPGVAGVGGRLVMLGTQLAIVVERVSLHTGLGEISLPCKPAALDYAFENGACTAFAAAIEVDGKAGVSAGFTLHYRFPSPSRQGAGWRIEGIDGGDPQVRWSSGDGEGAGGADALVLDLAAGRAGALRFGAADGRVHVLVPAQASAQRWLVLAQEGGKGELAGCLERRDGELSQPTQLRLAYRWTAPLDQPAALFGPVAADSRVRVDGCAVWRSKGWGGAAEAPLRMLSGHLMLDNDYAFAFAQETGDPVTMSDRVHCWFDRQPLDADGKLAGGTLHAMVEHRFHTGNVDAPLFSFQVPQAIGVATGRDGNTGMAANTVILLSPETAGAPAPQVAPQVLYEGDPALGACLGPPLRQGRVGGMLLRLPLRSGQGRAVLKVLRARLPDLAWFPLVLPPAGQYYAAVSGWQERRALAHALDAGAIAELCTAHTAAEFASGLALPCDGDTLPEWSAAAEVRGWLHSGLLSEGVGVLPTPWYAGVPAASIDSASQSAVAVTLYVPDPAAAGGLRRVAQALVAEAAQRATDGALAPDGAALLAWGASEALRRSLRTSALVMAHGRPALSGAVPRRFMAAAIDDEATAPPLLPDPARVRHSALVELLRPAEAAAPPPQVLTARTDQDAVLEVVDAQPLVAVHEPAMRFRLVLNHLADDAGRAAPVVGPGTALSKRQQIAFAATPPDVPAPRRVLPLLSPPAAGAGHAVSPTQVDVRTAVLRPGDMVYTHWALRGLSADTGPGLETGLRSPRAGNAAAEGTPALALEQAGEAPVDGVTWALQRVTAARALGPVPEPLPGSGIEVTVVTPAETEHRLVAPADPGGRRKLALGVAVRQADDAELDETARELSMRLLDPLLCAAFPHAVDGLLPAGSELAWAVAAGDGADGRGNLDALEPVRVSSVAEIGAGARALELWNTGEPVRVVRLGQWQPLADRPGSGAAEAYSLEVGADLARLLQFTRKKRNMARHWLLKEGLAAGPLLVLLIRTGVALRYVVAFDIDWHRGAALEQPERVLAVRGGQVLGFGDLAGPGYIRVEDAGFVLYRTAYVLEPAARFDEKVAAQAWLFGPGGACSAIAQSSAPFAPTGEGEADLVMPPFP